MISKKLLMPILSLIFSLGLFAQNNSITVDGTNDYISIADHSILDLSSSFTIEFWIKPLSNTGGEVMCKTNSDEDENFRIYVDPQTNDLYFDYGNSIQYTSTNQFTINLNTWYHLAFTVSAGEVGHIFLNGIEATNYSVQALSPNPIPTNNHALEIGGSTEINGGRYFNCSLDEVRIWNDIRSETEIRQNMYRELPNPSSETNLVAYYKLNEPSGITAEDSKGSNDGTLTNMVGNEWQTSPAMFGPKNCLEFDGSDDWINTNVTMPSVYTKEAWVYIPSYNGKDNNVISGGPSDGQHAFWISVGYGYKLSAGHNGVWNAVQDPNQIPFDSWQHIAVTYDANGTMTLYRNGVQVDQAYGVGPFNNGTAVRIGSFGINSNNLGGKLDEVRIWNDVRTESEIRKNMCKTITGNESGLVAYYNFDNSSGSTLQDFSGNGYDGTLTNMDGNSDWVTSSAFNTWLNTDDSNWSTASNWSKSSIPGPTSNVGVHSYSGATNLSISGSPTINSLVLGSSSAMSLSSGFTVNGNLILESDQNLNGQTITLGTSAYLIEDEGRFYGTSGSITTTRSLSNIDENVAGLGAEITTSANMGSTTITRTHAAASSPSSIQRRYNISPTNNSGLNATLVFHYCEDELNGLTESYLELSKSTNGGSSWTDQNGSVNTFYNTITLSGINSFSLWTATESDETSPPVLETQNPVHDYTQNSPAITIAPSTTVTTSSTIENATVSISPIIAADVLSVSNLPGGLSQTWDNTTKILTISGTGSASDYQTALRNVKFSSSASSEDTRTIDFILGDGVGLMINGEQHYYEVINNVNNISWTNARANALTSRFGMAQGYLATVTSAEENDYLAEKVTANTWIGATDSEVEGIWRWIDGPEAHTQFWLGDVNAGNNTTTNFGSAVNEEYSNWWYGGEPNNVNNEDYAHMYGSNSGAPAGYWNDFSNVTSVQFYIVEYGGDGSNFTTIDNATIVVNGVNWTGDIDSDWDKPGNWSSNSIPDANTDIMIPNVTNDPVVNAGTGANCNNLSISAGAVLTIESDGSLITNGNISNSGTINIKRTMSQGQWHMVSPPISDGLSGVFDGDYLQIFNEEDDWWYEISSTDTELTPVKGYGVWSNGSSTKTYTFSGTPNTGDQSISLTAQGSGGSHNRANLVGNPYPSAIDWNSVSGYGAKYTWNGTAYEAYPAEDGYGVGARYAAPMQGFFIIPASSGTFSLTNDNRTHSGANGFEKSSKELKNGLVVFADNDDYQDKLVIVFNEESYDYFELEKDAWKILSNVEGLSQIYTLANDKKLSIDNRPETEMIQLGFQNDANGNYSIGVFEMDGIAKAELEDTKLNKFHDLNQGAYAFDWQTTDSEERFILHLKATGIEDLEEQDVQVYAANGQLYIRMMESGGFDQLAIYDLAGRQIYETKLQNQELQSIDLNHLSGVYLVQLKNSEYTITKKILMN